MKKYVLKNLHLRLTGRCNKQCAHCFAAINNHGEDLPLEYWVGIMKKAKEMGTENITITGGEPFVYQHISALLDKMAEIDMTFSVETNGILLEKYSEKLLKLPRIRKISISPDITYSDDEMEKVIMLAKKMINSGLPIQLQTSVMPDKIDKKLDYLHKIARYNIPVRVMLGHNGLGKSKHLEENMSYADMLKVYHDLKGEKNIICDLPPMITRETSKNSSCGWNTVRGDIMPDGSFTPCAAIAWNYPDFIIGYVDEKTLEKVWNENEKLKKLRKLTREDFGGACKQCEHYEQCKGSCVAVSLGRGNNLMSGYPLCTFYKESCQ